MGIFKKKTDAIDVSFEVAEPTEQGCLGDAEQIANVVEAGLSAENYSGINAKLSDLARREEGRERYVFDHPGMVSRVYAIAICVALSFRFARYLLIGIGTVALSAELAPTGFVLLIVAGLFIAANLFLICRLVSSVAFKKRYDAYGELLGYRGLEFVEDLAECSGQSEETVVRDLLRAVEKKLIPQGHFSSDNLVFIVSDAVYDKYKEKPFVYDRYFRKVIEERRRVEERPERVRQILEDGDAYLGRIRGYGQLVKDKAVSRKIGELERIASMIFHEVGVSPGLAQSLGVFLNYYMPTSEKLLEAYVTLGEKQASGKTLKGMRKDVEETLGTLVTAFEGVLEKLYQEYEMDITSEIDALELSMKQEGLVA